jgi:hypothetical protein
MAEGGKPREKAALSRPKRRHYAGAMIGGEQNEGEGVGRGAYDAAFPRVGDALTLYAWRVPAFHVVRAAAPVGVSGTTVTLVEAVLSALVFALFWNAQYWIGLIVALGVTLVSVVALMLERTAPGHPAAGKRFRQVVGLIPPPFWWWAWEHGLAAAGHPLAPVYATMVLWVVVGGYFSDRVIEGLSLQRFGGMSIHDWRPVDSRFRLVAAGRNANLVILTGPLLFNRPDLGLELIAWWTLIGLIFHSVRLAQLTERQARREKIASWLDR